jgi:hypothetical protein
LAIGFAGPAIAEEATGATSDIMIVKDTGGTGVEASEEGKGAQPKTDAEMPDTGAGSMTGGGDKADDQGGTGVKAAADSEGATNKSTDDPDADMGMNEGDSSGNAPGGTGVEASAEGDGAKNKN